MAPQIERNSLLLPPEPEKAEREAGLPHRFVSPVDPALPIKEEAVAIDPGHAYTLAELIDIAQRSNKQTRVAWEAARQAAITVGIALGAYLPDITAQVIGGYQRLNSPFPDDLVRQGFIEANVAEVLPGITVKWLLFDFGGRSQAVAAAERLTVAANAEFTAVHQKLIFDVARTYYMLDAVETQLAAAREALTNARRVDEAAKALYDRGVDEWNRRCRGLRAKCTPFGVCLSLDCQGGESARSFPSAATWTTRNIPCISW